MVEKAIFSFVEKERSISIFSKIVLKYRLGFTKYMLVPGRSAN